MEDKLLLNVLVRREGMTKRPVRFTKSHEIRSRFRVGIDGKLRESTSGVRFDESILVLARNRKRSLASIRLTREGRRGHRREEPGGIRRRAERKGKTEEARRRGEARREEARPGRAVIADAWVALRDRLP